ncbi:EAL domain-containing protein [Rheinheimera mangrovi]|uniref:EAL domain-containing protein n=1 Tax=Rheinheimera mangrovi TaxID=2498451 RepID=UPI000F8E7F5C|nr:EAL domain-containing protein [Rheinheimera mangrovi]
MHSKILIVDDEAAVQRSLERLLCRAGYQVIVASSGAQALELLTQHQVHIVLTDFRMPLMCGNELLRAVKKHYPQIVGLILSGYADFNAVVETLNSGIAYKFLQKPWTDHLLLDEIQRSELEYQRRTQPDLYTQLLISSQDALIEVNTQGQILRVNAALAKLWQLDPANISNSPLSAFLPALPIEQLQQFLMSQQSTLVCLDHQHHEVELSHRLTRAEHLLLKLERLESLPQFSSDLSSLSNLLNHQQACQVLEQQIAAQSGLIAVAVLDIDNFSLINDAIGYHKTDLLINKVAFLLQQQLKAGQHLVYLSGDKFALIFTHCRDEMAIQLAMSECLSVFDKPVMHDERLMQLNFNLGYAIAPDDTVIAEKLLKYANLACRTNRNNQHHFYMRFEQAILESKKQQFEISNALYNDIEHNGFSLNFQPKISLADGRIRQAEVLLRWNHPTLGSISPALFVPIAERDGQIIRIGLWVLEQSLIALRSFYQQGLELGWLSINVSGRQLQDPTFSNSLQQLLRSYGIKPEQIELEITETYLMEDIELSNKVLLQLHQIGVRISMDDFGTGYSSLAYLTKLPIDEVKLDRSLITELSSDLQSQGMVRNIIRMAHDLNLVVTAEGIETQEQQQLLNAMDCDLIQGYYYSKPLTEKDFITILKQQPFAGGLSNAH